MNCTQPIDAVVTWVDGSDPLHEQRLTKYLETLPAEKRPIFHKTRFSDMGEIVYCIESILHFAPWIRKIFIVADQQQPAFIEAIADTELKNRIQVIDHQDIFKGHEEYLPTFNTRSITSMLWRIPDLSEQFIYFNDDYLLTCEAQPEDFFVNGKAILRGKWKLSVVKDFKDWIKKVTRNSQKPLRAKHTTSQRVAAKTAGYSYRYFMVPHNPHAFLKSTWKRYYDTNTETIVKQISFKLRSVEQFNVDAFSAHLNLSNQKAVVKNDIKSLIIKSETMASESIQKCFEKCFEQNNRFFLCIQSLDNASPAIQKLILQQLESRIPPIIRQFLKNKEVKI
jgi:hypothetical protein